MPVTALKQDGERNEAGIAQAVDRLKTLFGERCSSAYSVREQHGHTTTWIENQMPDAVVFAESTDEVVSAVRICNEFKVPMIPFGVGSSLEGHLNAPLGGISIDVSRMKSVLKVNAEDLDCVLQPGVTREELNSYLRDTGLFFPIDPGAHATMGGMASTRASGTNAVRYGTMKDVVLGLTVVTPQGNVIKTGGRAKKSSAGYDLTRLYVGSEGTLGIITELTIRLFGLPEAISGGICPFPSVEAACQAVSLTIQAGVPVARIELLNKRQVEASNSYFKLELEETPTLFLEFHGSESSVKEQAELFGSIAEEFGAGTFTWTSRPEERTKLWTARHNAYYAAQSLRPGCKGLSTDVCVPISRLAECVTATEQDLNESGLQATIVGHVGDGNFHVIMLVDMDDADEITKVDEFIERLAWRAIDMEGTCTGEHGVGQGKMKYLEKEHGNDALDVMRAIKKALDPDNIMNPGKIVVAD